MALSSFTVTIMTKSDSPFNVIPNAPIEIRERLANGSSGGLSLIFSDQAGLNPITQVGFTANSLGQATFFAAAADYNAVYDNNGTPVTIAVDVGVTGGILDERFDRLNPATLTEALNDASIQVEDVVTTKELTSGKGGGATYDVVLTSSVTPNGDYIVIGVANPLISFERRGISQAGLVQGVAGLTPLKGISSDLIGRSIVGFDSYFLDDFKEHWLIASVPASGTISSINRTVRTTTIDGIAYKIYKHSDAGIINRVVYDEILGINDGATVAIGSQGVEVVADPAPTRAAWDAVSGNPTPAANSLEVAGNLNPGNWIEDGANGVSMFGGSLGYFSYVKSSADLAIMNAGDHVQEHLAGVIFAYHCDMTEGSHGGIFGGSFKQMKGDYGFSVGGTVHEVYGLQSGIIGGRNCRIGDSADLIAVRRSTIIGGEFNEMPIGEQSTIIGGDTNKISANNAVIVGGQFNEVQPGANDAIIMGSNASADVPRVNIYSNGQFTSKGDNQVYVIGARRSITAGTQALLSTTGGGSGDVYAAPANSIIIIDFMVSVIRTDVLGDRAAWKITATFSNVSGSLVMDGQDITTLFNPVGYTINAEVRGAGLNVGLQVTAPAAVDFIATAFGNMSVMKIV